MTRADPRTVARPSRAVGRTFPECKGTCCHRLASEPRAFISVKKRVQTWVTVSSFPETSLASSPGNGAALFQGPTGSVCGLGQAIRGGLVASLGLAGTGVGLRVWCHPAFQIISLGSASTTFIPNWALAAACSEWKVLLPAELWLLCPQVMSQRAGVDQRLGDPGMARHPPPCSPAFSSPDSVPPSFALAALLISFPAG